MRRAWESVLWLGILLAVVPGHEEKTEYCAKCGMARETESTLLLTKPLFVHQGLRTTPYTVVYQYATQQTCKHQWRFCCRGWTYGIFGLMGSGVGDGWFSETLLHPERLPQIANRTPRQMAQLLKPFQWADGNLR